MKKEGEGERKEGEEGGERRTGIEVVGGRGGWNLSKKTSSPLNRIAAAAAAITTAAAAAATTTPPTPPTPPTIAAAVAVAAAVAAAAATTAGAAARDAQRFRPYRTMKRYGHEKQLKTCG